MFWYGYSNILHSLLIIRHFFSLILILNDEQGMTNVEVVKRMRLSYSA